ncbi:MAG TPA: twin-arginine translocase TatA/TatE family subunit [Sphingomicrobium sp.]|jgi:sec-independent protein translocase protein TatA|nr:twin-arginine translocase TatA/TatE family subunit [Sphingomicrobium sp.]HXH52433.1 twin-arginine translocase TatA/TatE family subunit [Sphingomicrobium sp.]
MGSFSLIHWIILGVVILLLFGGNRFSAMMSDVAKGLKSFKKGLAEDEEERNRDQRSLPPQGARPDQPIDVTPEPRRPADPVPPQGDERSGG